MKRRMLCCALVMPMLATIGRAQAQPARAFRVAWVSLEKAGSASPVFAAFRAGMAELGYREGTDLVIDAWWGDGSMARLEQLRGDILRARPDVIVAQGGIALVPMLHASVDRPVLFSMSGDPVEAKVVDSYAHPGGKATGITLFAAELAVKRMAMLKEVLPRMRSIAVIANPGHAGAPRELQSSRDGAAQLGLALTYFPTRSVADLDAALAQHRPGANGRDPRLLRRLRARPGGPHRGLFLARAHSRGGGLGQLSRAAATCWPTGRSSPTSTGAWPATPTASERARARATCRWNSRPGSSWSSTSGPHARSASPCRARCCCRPTR